MEVIQLVWGLDKEKNLNSRNNLCGQIQVWLPTRMSLRTRFFNHSFLNKMPKIVVKVDRSAQTRSKTLDEKKVHPNEDTKHGESAEKSRNTTPSKNPTRQEPRSSISRVRRSTVKLADRKFFTVQEDCTILNYVKDQKDTLSSRQIAEHLSKKLKHSVESIRDRIKRFLSKLRPIDQQYIVDQAKVSFELSFSIQTISDQ